MSGIDAKPSEQVLQATSNLGGLAATAASGGNINVGKAAAAATSVATLAANPRGATQNVFTLARAANTLNNAVNTMKSF